MEANTSKTALWFLRAIILASLIALAALPVQAGTVYKWIGGTDTWDGVTTNWNPNGVPGNLDIANILGSDAVVILGYDYSSGNALGDLLVDDGASLTQSGYNLTVSDITEIGYSGEGIFTLTGGIHTTRFLSIGAYADGDIQGNGYYNNSGGVNNVKEDLYLGYYSENLNGTYDLSGTGILSALNEYIGFGGKGTFLQSGATSNTVSGSLVLGDAPGSTGTYTIGTEGGTDTPSLTTSSMKIGNNGTGTFTQYGGSTTVKNDLVLGAGVGSRGEYNLHGGSLSVLKDEYVGKDAAATGIFNQYGGTHNVAGNLYIDMISDSKGYYNLNNGTLNVDLNTYVGYSGAGVFNHFDGSNTIGGDLNLGEYSGTSGTYVLGDETSDASLDVKGAERIGVFGTGSFTQKVGTTHEVGSDLVLGNDPGGYGEYNMAGGDLTVGGVDEFGNPYGSTIVGNSGNGDFNQSGGTHTISTDLNLGQYARATGKYFLSDDSGNGEEPVTLIVNRHEHIGVSGKGNFSQSGGTTHTITDNLVLGNDEGSEGGFDLSGNGSLDVGANVYVGARGTGTFNQSGDSENTINGNLRIGEESGGFGVYNLSDGLLNVSSGVGEDGEYGYNAGYTVIGHNGSGEFNQSNDSNFSAGVLVLGGGPYAGDLPSSKGIYNMSGGTLTAHLLEVGRDDGKGIFTQTGGSVTTDRLSMGSFEYGDGVYTISNDAELTVNGIVEVGYADTGKAVFTQTGDSSVTVTDRILIDETGTYSKQGGELTAAGIYNYGQFQGTGEIDTIYFENSGELNPGSSPGTLTIDGDFAQGLAGILNIELGGYTQGTDYDWLEISGTATLGGDLVLGLWESFVPKVGDTFDILTAGSIFDGSGFNRVFGPSGFSWNIAYLDMKGSDGFFDTVQVTANAVPIPAAAWLFGSAILGIVGMRRRHSSEQGTVNCRQRA